MIIRNRTGDCIVAGRLSRDAEFSNVGSKNTPLTKFSIPARDTVQPDGSKQTEWINNKDYFYKVPVNKRLYEDNDEATADGKPNWANYEPLYRLDRNTIYDVTAKVDREGGSDPEHPAELNVNPIVSDWDDNIAWNYTDKVSIEMVRDAGEPARLHGRQDQGVRQGGPREPFPGRGHGRQGTGVSPKPEEEKPTRPPASMISCAKRP